MTNPYIQWPMMMSDVIEVPTKICPHLTHPRPNVLLMYIVQLTHTNKLLSIINNYT